MQNSAADDRDVFISRFNRVLACVAWALVMFMLVAYVWADQGLRNPAVLVPAALVALGAWVALWRPRMVVDDDAIQVRNVFRTITVPWASLIHVDTKYAFTLFTPGHRYSVWAAPAPGRTGAAIAERKQTKGRVATAPHRADGTMRPGDLIATESGEASYLVRERWERLRDSGRIQAGVAHETAVGIQVHWWLNGTLALLALGSILTFVH